MPPLPPQQQQTSWGWDRVLCTFMVTFMLWFWFI